MTDAEEGLVHIGEVVERTGLSHRTIRYYEELGLVAPAGRTDGGFRLYDEAGIDRLLFIKPMKPLGFSLEEVREVVTALDTVTNPAASDARRARARESLRSAHVSAQQRVSELKAATARAEAFARRLGREIASTPAATQRR